jgi:hypothetical protein
VQIFFRGDTTARSSKSSVVHVDKPHSEDTSRRRLRDAHAVENETYSRLKGGGHQERSEHRAAVETVDKWDGRVNDAQQTKVDAQRQDSAAYKQFLTKQGKQAKRSWWKKW